MNLFALSGLLNFFSSLIFGFFVFFKDRKSRIFQLWLAFSLSVAIWEFGAFRIGLITDKQMAFVWWRIAHIGVILIPVFFTLFVYAWLKIRRKSFFYFSCVFGLFFSVVNLYDLLVQPSGLFIVNMRWVFNSFYYDSPPSPLYSIFVFLWLFIVLYAHYELLKIYKVSTGTKRSQIQYFIFAFVVAYAGGATSFLPVFNVDFYPYFNFTAPFYPILMSYAIVRHRLMDIKLVARRSTVYLASVLTIFLPAIPMLYLIDIYYPDFLISGSLAMIVVAVSIFSPIRDYFYRLANRYFFSSLYDSREVISSLTDKLRSTLEAGRIYFFIAQTLKNAFHSKALGLLTFEEKNNTYTVRYNDGFLIDGQKIFPADRALDSVFIKKGITIIVEEIKKDYYKDHKEIFDLFARLGIEILTPLNVKDKTVGLIILGAKESRDMYNSEDLRVLEIAGAQAAISIENALLYEETKNFAITLKYEVEKATSELRAANEQLKKLDQAKSDFISMVSHQLRTPLTAIKGFTSMVMEGSYGPVGSRVRDQLGKVSESAERLIRLVNDLLDVSHMEGGKMEFNFAKVDFGAMVAGVVEELQPQAQKGSLNLEFPLEKSGSFFVRADEQKLRQVVINLVDNAVKYTRQGSVNVGFEKKDGFVQLSVKDTGVGMDKETIDNLFKKFVRGAGASHYHTEGAGVGLYVAKQLIEAHRGQIWAESEGEGKGSEFFVKLPEYK